MTILMQAKASDTGELSFWSAASADFGGSGYPGTGSPLEIAIYQRDDDKVSAEKFGFSESSTPTTNSSAIANAFASFGLLGGTVYLPDRGRYKIANLTIPPNCSLVGSSKGDQDEGWNYGYSSFWSCLICSGTISVGHGAGIEKLNLISSAVEGEEIPTNDTEANTLVGLFSGTAITLQGTGTVCRDLIILGFEHAIVDSGNRHRIENVRYDCTNGLTIGGGSDVTRVKDVHGWSYMTAELGLSLSVNYRSGWGLKLQNNNDYYTFENVYSYGHEYGFIIAGSAGKVCQSPTFVSCRADSGNIGSSGTSVGWEIQDYTAYPTMIECSTQNYDIGLRNNTRGAYLGSGSERLNTTRWIGGKILECDDHFAHIVNGKMMFTGTDFAKDDNSPTSVFDWGTSDGGAIVNCTFDELGGTILDAASTVVRNSIECRGNKRSASVTNEFWVFAPDTKIKESTVAGLPSAADNEGAIRYVSNGDAGSPCLTYADGTNWLVISLGAPVSTT